MIVIGVGVYYGVSDVIVVGDDGDDVGCVADVVWVIMCVVVCCEGDVVVVVMVLLPRCVG